MILFTVMKQYLCPPYSFKLFLVTLLIFVGCSEKPVVQGENEVAESSETNVVFVTDPDKVLQGPVTSLPQQVINLNGGGLLFIKIAIQTVDLNPIKDETSHLPKYIDSLILVASDYTEDELVSMAGRENLKKELINSFNELSDSDHQIANIYYENFIIR